jgi:hypothetical protein
MNTTNKTNKTSKRGSIIEIYLEIFMRNQMYTINDNLKEDIQCLLDKKLSFKTTVSEINNENGFLSGDVIFKSEYGDNRAINFTVKSGEIEYA